MIKFLTFSGLSAEFWFKVADTLHRDLNYKDD